MLLSVFSRPSELWIQRQRQPHGNPAIYICWRPNGSQMFTITREVAEFARQNPALTTADHAALLAWLAEWAATDAAPAQAKETGGSQA